MRIDSHELIRANLRDVGVRIACPLSFCPIAITRDVKNLCTQFCLQGVVQRVCRDAVNPFHGDRQFALEAVSMDGLLLMCATSSLQEDPEVVLAAVKERAGLSLSSKQNTSEVAARTYKSGCRNWRIKRWQLNQSRGILWGGGKGFFSCVFWMS